MDTPTRRQVDQLVGTVLEQRYVLVEATDLEAEEVRFISYDMQKLTHVDIVVPLDKVGVPCTKRFKRADEQQPPTQPTQEERDSSPLLRLLRARHQARQRRSRTVPSDPTLQLSDADLMEVGLFDVSQTIQLLESELVEVLDDPPPPLFQRGDDAESHLRSLLRRRLWIGWGAALALVVLVAMAWMVLTPAEVSDVEPSRTAVEAISAALELPVPATNVPVAAPNVPVLAPDVPVAAPSASVPAPEVAVPPDRPARQEPVLAKQPKVGSVAVVAKRKTHRRHQRVRRRSVDPDAILASARAQRPIMQSTVDPFSR